MFAANPMYSTVQRRDRSTNPVSTPDPNGVYYEAGHTVLNTMTFAGTNQNVYAVNPDGSTTLVVAANSVPFMPAQNNQAVASPSPSIPLGVQPYDVSLPTNLSANLAGASAFAGTPFVGPLPATPAPETNPPVYINSLPNGGEVNPPGTPTLGSFIPAPIMNLNAGGVGGYVPPGSSVSITGTGGIPPNSAGIVVIALLAWILLK